MWGTLIFKKNGVSKAQFFLASQGRRLEAGAARVSLCGIVLVQLQTNNFRLYFSGTLPPGTGKKYGLYENLAVPKSGQKVWFRFKHAFM